jgi:hypothetical protein
MDWIVHTTGSTIQAAFKDLRIVLYICTQHKISLADRTAENIHERPFHTSSSLKSMIWVTSGPVEIRVTGLPISSSACLMKSFALLVSFA